MYKNKKCFTLTIGCILTFVITGCTSFEHYKNPDAAAEETECKYDSFNNNVTCTMPEIGTCSDGRETNFSFGKCPFPSSHVFLRVAYNNSSKMALYVINGYVRSNGWNYPYKVLDNSGKNFSFDKQTSKVDYCYSGNCVTKEYFSISIDRGYIRRHIRDGINMKIYGKKGGSLIKIPTAYVQGFEKVLQDKGL